jgi:hypothetical protein
MAWRTLIWPLGIGRQAVRATRASKSRSARSLTVQPAPRMTSAPAAKSRASQRSGACPVAAAASARLHQQGSSRSQVPIGRSKRTSRR